MVEYGLLHHFVFIKVCGLATPRVNASLNYGLHGIMMCQCLFIITNVLGTIHSGVNIYSEEGCVCMYRARGMCKLFLIQICSDPNTNL